MSPIMVFMGFVVIIATVLFYDQVMSIFHGMSVLDSLKLIINFLLHAIVVAIVSITAVKLPDMIRPWAKWFKAFPRTKTKSRRQATAAPAAARKAPQLTQAERLVKLLMLFDQQKKSRSVRMFRNKTKKKNNIFLKF